MTFDELARIMLADYQKDLMRWISIFTKIEGGLGEWHPLTDALARVLTAARVKGEMDKTDTMETLTYAFNVIEEYSDQYYGHQFEGFQKRIRTARAA
jgi:hypothetical protein